MPPTENGEIEKVVSDFYADDTVTAIITLKVDTKEVDSIATDLSKFDCTEDVLLVTGDTDIIAKARFDNYRMLKDFVVSQLAHIRGVKDTKTLMVVSTYKERGVPRKEG